MNLEVINFVNDSGKIYKKYICSNHGGSDIAPSIKWDKIDNAKSYAFIIEDPDAVGGTFIHWYIPFIDLSINELDNFSNNNLQKKYNDLQKKNISISNNMKVFQGKNSIGEFGYHGPCAPDGSGIHRYIFKLYAFDTKVLVDSNMITIKTAEDFIIILKKKYPKIKILATDEKIFRYEYKN
jgi:Raf kinase inhibitor-like YbhB/YbcL family protein